MMNFAFPRKFDNRMIIVVMDSSYTTQIVLIFESSPLEDRRVRRAKKTKRQDGSGLPK